MVTEFERSLRDIGELPTTAFPVGDKAVPASAMAQMVAELGRRDPEFVVTNADGNEASNMKAINEKLKIRHPTEDALYNQSPSGQVYEPLNEDAHKLLAQGYSITGQQDELIASGATLWNRLGEPGNGDQTWILVLYALAIAGIGMHLFFGFTRQHYRVETAAGAGVTTSGTFSPTLQKAIALARVPFDAIGECAVEIRGKSFPARIVRPPFVRHGQVCDGILSG